MWAGGELYQMAALLFHCYAQRDAYSTHTPTFTHRCTQKPCLFRGCLNPQADTYSTHTPELWAIVVFVKTHFTRHFSCTFKVMKPKCTWVKSICVTVIPVIQYNGASQYKAVVIKGSSQVLMCVWIRRITLQKKMLRVFAYEELFQCSNLHFSCS